MALISFGEFSFGLLFPFTAPIFYCIRGYILFLIQLQWDKYPLVLVFLMFLGESFIGLIGLCKSVKEMIIKKQEKNIVTKTVFNKVFTCVKTTPAYDKKSNYFFIFLIAFSDLIATYGVLICSSFLQDNSKNPEIPMKISEILFASLLSYFILKIRFYLHQVISIVLTVIGLGLLLIPLIDIRNYLTILLSSGCFVFFYFFYSVQEVLEKWLMQNRFVNEIKLIMLEGLMGMSICFILFIGLYFCPCLDSWEFCSDNRFDNILVIFHPEYTNNPLIYLYYSLYALSSSFINLWSILTIKFFSPTHRSISDCLRSFLLWVFFLIYNSIYNYTDLLSLLGYIIVIISCLLYNEVIICYFWGLNENTKIEIKKRSDEEFVMYDWEIINVEKGDEEESFYSEMENYID